MNPTSLKGRIALKLLLFGLLFFLLSFGLFWLVRPFGTFTALSVSILYFSVSTFISAYIVCGYELWVFKKLAEGVRRAGDGRGDPLAGISLPDEAEEVRDVLLDLERKKEEAVLSQKRFLADASHEMRSPITIIKGNMEIALRRERDVKEYQTVLTSNLEEIDRLERLVKDLMFLARSDASELVMNMAPVGLGEVMEQVCRGLGTLARSKGVGLSFDSGLPIEEGVIEGDRDRLVQLFINLVENAIRYTPKGGGVTLGLSRLAGVLKATVTDTGIGIPEAELGMIFDRFYRVEKARSREAGGTGLGLCICKWIVEAHDGEISIESAEGVGTKVTVMFLPAEV
jgi:signal transduction histidine kinase